MRRFTQFSRLCAVTLLELLVVVMIISILASIAAGMYAGQTERARIAASRDLLHSLEVAITRYEIDTGTLPPSGSGVEVPPTPLGTTSVSNRLNGSGYLHLALMHSLSGSALTPASATWKGPYLNLQKDQVALREGVDVSDSRGMTDIVDAWGTPILYVAWPEYNPTPGVFWGGTRMFNSTAPAGADPALPAPNPFAATETYYNPRTFQLISYGPNAKTLGITAVGGLITLSHVGAEEDDINNFGY